jgi:hypothetical protein
MSGPINFKSSETLSKSFASFVTVMASTNESLQKKARKGIAIIHSRARVFVRLPLREKQRGEFRARKDAGIEFSSLIRITFVAPSFVVPSLAPCLPELDISDSFVAALCVIGIRIIHRVFYVAYNFLHPRACCCFSPQIYR